MVMIGLAALALILAAIPASCFEPTCENIVRRLAAPSPREGSINASAFRADTRAQDNDNRRCCAGGPCQPRRRFEVVVLDDHSETPRPTSFRPWRERDPRVRFLQGQPLPAGWCGKQFACSILARAARHSLLVFLDADVRLAPDGLARITTYLEESRADLVSGIPRQETGTLVEKLVIPLIHFVLLGFLPLGQMRRYRHPAYAAGCGQFFLARRSAYEAAGGHSAIQASLHDGITLPRGFRAAGFRTDLCDMTEIATCRMYQTAGDVCEA